MITPTEVLLARVNKLADEHGKYEKKIFSQLVTRNTDSLRVWQAPLSGMVKINVEASLTDEGWIGLGYCG